VRKRRAEAGEASSGEEELCSRKLHDVTSKASVPIRAKLDKYQSFW
jgi:hypothetical protein